MKFSGLNLSTPLQKAIQELGFHTPTEIQEKAIPILKTGKTDFIGLAHTGTGKSAAFGLPLLDLIDVNSDELQAVIMLPTRELGQQIGEQLKSYAKFLPEVKIEAVTGGAPLKPQMKAFKQAVHIVVATPGRLIDLIQKEAIDLSHVRYLILDEADEMLNMGFKEDLERLIGYIGEERYTWLFSATMTPEVRQVVNRYMKSSPQEVKINTLDKPKITHEYHLVDPIEKFELLTHFLNENEEGRGIIFCRTKTAVQKLYKQLAMNKFSAGALHGDLPQGLRDRVMDQFRQEQIKILVASDVAARGIDMQDLAYVIHYHLPEVAEVYTHRSGRTARAGKSGISLSFVFKEELEELKNIEKETGIKITLKKKPGSESVESNKTYLWARRILKTKPDPAHKEIREKVGEVFHHLSKDELIDRLVAEQMVSGKPLLDPRLGNRSNKDPKTGNKNLLQEDTGGKQDFVKKDLKSGKKEFIPEKKTIDRPFRDSGNKKGEDGGRNRRRGKEGSDWD